MSDRKHISALDGVRGVAVSVVFFYHYGGGDQSHNFAMHALGWTLKLGWAGVSLFFALSGFLITGILWESREKPGWWSRFYSRRVLRIFPLYYLAVLLVAITAHWAGDVGPTALGVLWYSLDLQNEPFAHAAHHIPTPLILNHFWSLAVEEQFYLVWPFVIQAVKSRLTAQRLCVGLFVVSLAFRIVQATTGFQMPGGMTLARAGELAVGAWLALAYRGQGQPGQDRSWTWAVKWAPLLGGLSAAGVLAVGLRDGDMTVEHPLMTTAGFTLVALLSVSVVCMAISREWMRRIMSLGLLRWLGGISYGLYVYSVLFERLYTDEAARLLPNGSTASRMLVTLAIALPCTLAIAYASFRWFETPFLRLKDRLGERQKALV
jgi:peptidoglycan/LPS O-acetylase OafA/YrhL